MTQTSTLPSIGEVVDGKFRVERKLGEGGTSTIYAVRHVITDKAFAIKWLSPELADNDLAIERFVYEAKVCGRFVHRNAVQIYDVCQSSGSYYLLMELLEGESLDARLDRVQRFSVQAACDILLPCAEALDAAHRVGIVHRDLKPSNIFLSRVEGRAEEVPKILDFGISKLTRNGHDLSLVTTTTRTVIGTPQYMSPEQMRGQPPEPRFDIYALGVVLYELIAGERPFECDTFADLVFKIVETQPAPLDEIAGVPPAFAELVTRAMARNSGSRFASMAEFAAALRPYTANAPTPVPSIASTPRRKPALAPTRRIRKLGPPLGAAPGSVHSAASPATSPASPRPTPSASPASQPTQRLLPLPQSSSRSSPSSHSAPSASQSSLPVQPASPSPSSLPSSSPARAASSSSSPAPSSSPARAASSSSSPSRQSLPASQPPSSHPPSVSQPLMAAADASGPRLTAAADASGPRLTAAADAPGPRLPAAADGSEPRLAAAAEDAEVFAVPRSRFGWRERRGVVVVAGLGVALLVVWQTRAGVSDEAHTARAKLSEAEPMGIHHVRPAPEPIAQQRTTVEAESTAPARPFLPAYGHAATPKAPTTEKLAHRQPRPMAAKLEAAAAKSDPAAAKSDPAAAKSDPAAAKPEPVAARSEPVASKSEPVAAKSEPAAAKSEPGAAKSEPGAAKPEPGAAKPEPGAAKPEPGAAKPEPAAAKSEPAAVKSEVAATRPDSAAAKSEPKVARRQSIATARSLRVSRSDFEGGGKDDLRLPPTALSRQDF